MFDTLSQGAAAVVVEGAGIPDGLAVLEGTEAGVQVVIVRIDEFKRQHFASQSVAEPLLAFDLAANAVAGDERFATEEGVAGALEEAAFRQVLDHETVFVKPGGAERLFALPLNMAEMREDGSPLVNQGGVRREDQSGSPCAGWSSEISTP